ncbi:MAG TPA: hypothetical protein VF723_11435 [Pyrinomonadaceae bacterium]|jgi:hypothetical protein
MSEAEALLMERREDNTMRLYGATQSASNNPTIEFRDGQFLFRKTNLEGGLVERFISSAAVREAFSGIPIDSGWLKPEIVRWGDGRLGQWAVLFIPPGRHLLEITNDGSGRPFAVERIKTPLPGMVFFGLSNRYYAWAVKTETLEPYQEIYRCPLPNVMQDASICWGLLKPPMATPATIFEAWKLFITSTFNNHAASGKSRRCREDVRIVLKDMSRAPEPAHYPVNDLVRQVDRTGVTLDQAVRRFFEEGRMPG